MVKHIILQHLCIYTIINYFSFYKTKQIYPKFATSKICRPRLQHSQLTGKSTNFQTFKTFLQTSTSISLIVTEAVAQNRYSNYKKCSLLIILFRDLRPYRPFVPCIYLSYFQKLLRIDHNIR